MAAVATTTTITIQEGATVVRALRLNLIMPPFFKCPACVVSMLVELWLHLASVPAQVSPVLAVRDTPVSTIMMT